LDAQMPDAQILDVQILDVQILDVQILDVQILDAQMARDCDRILRQSRPQRQPLLGGHD